MDKKKKIAIVILALVIAAAAAVLGFLFLDSIAAQGICILTAMILAAVVLALSIEKEALHALVLVAAPFVSAPFLKFFEASELAEWIGGKYNAGAVFACQRMGMEVPGKIGNREALVITFVLVFTVIYLIVLGLRSWIGAKQGGDSSLDKDFPEKNYRQKCADFCEYLDRRVRDINKETDWSAKTYTPIEAEVEMTDKRRKQRRYEDLHKCLRRHRRKNKVFLVLGDPGSGKSVSMRKLCMDMMKEVKRNNPIPVYVDLKRWTEAWSLEHLPTEDDLLNFIERILREDGTTYEGQFLKDYFRKMLHRGKWYFIFDSFDEMPCLMGRKNCQELIDKLSGLLHNFLTREYQLGGIIASRLFRSPSDALEAAVRLTLQPFSDEKIKRMLNLYTDDSDELVHALFSGREDLVALCRNPFYLSLLIEYSLRHGADLPQNQMELYENFIESRIGSCAQRIDELGLRDSSQVRAAARQLALYMQKYGLECPLSELYKCDDGRDWQKVLELLRYARICRFGGTSSTVSFVHRRFQECFYVSNIKENLLRLDPERYSSIEKNNDIRDALVLYSEIAPLEKAREIADHCWSVLQAHKAAAESIRNPGCVELVNTLYFMAEAFRNRREAMAHFQAEFQQYILEMLEAREFPVQHAAVSSMVLFEQPQLLQMVLKVLEKENRYLSDVVMKNCRTMTQIPWDISHRMARHIADMDQSTFLRQFRSMDFSLSLSKQLRYVRLVHAVRYIHALLDQVLMAMIVPVSFVFLLLTGSGTAVLFLEKPEHILMGLVLCLLWMLVRADAIIKKDGMEVLAPVHLIGYAALILPYMVVTGAWVLVIPTCITYVLLLSVLWGVYWIQIMRVNTLRSLYTKTKNALRKIWKDNRTSIQALIVIMFGFAVFSVLILHFMEEKLIELFELLMSIVCGISCCLAVGMSLGREFLQWRWLRKQLPVTTLDRSVLASNLEKHLQSSRFKRRYLENLIERKVKLTGEWPEGKRPKMRRDDVERLLAILDCAGIDNLRMEF